MDKWKGPENRADKVGLDLERLKKARAANKMETGKNTAKTWEANSKLVKQEKRVGARRKM